MGKGTKIVRRMANWSKGKLEKSIASTDTTIHFRPDPGVAYRDLCSHPRLHILRHRQASVEAHELCVRGNEARSLGRDPMSASPSPTPWTGGGSTRRSQTLRGTATKCSARRRRQETSRVMLPAGSPLRLQLVKSAEQQRTPPKIAGSKSFSRQVEDRVAHVRQRGDPRCIDCAPIDERGEAGGIGDPVEHVIPGWRSFSASRW
jgi:hypothetical protein